MLWAGSGDVFSGGAARAASWRVRRAVEVSNPTLTRHLLFKPPKEVEGRRRLRRGFELVNLSALHMHRAGTWLLRPSLPAPSSAGNLEQIAETKLCD